MKVYKKGHRWGGWTLTPRRSLVHDSAPESEFVYGDLRSVRSTLWVLRRVLQEPRIPAVAACELVEALMDLADVHGADAREIEVAKRRKGSAGGLETVGSQNRFKSQLHLRRLTGRMK